MRSSSARSAAVSARFIRSLWIATWSSCCAQERARLGAEPLEVVRSGEAGQVHRCLVAHLVLEVGVDRLALLLLDQLDQRAEPLADALQHRQRHVLPPLVGLHVLDQRQLLPHHRDARLFLQQPGDRLHLVAQPLEAPAPREAPRAAGSAASRSNRLASSSSGSSSDGRPATSWASSASASSDRAVHASALRVLLHQPALRPHHEVVEVHRRHLAVQQLRRDPRAARPSLGRRPAARPRAPPPPAVRPRAGGPARRSARAAS